MLEILAHHAGILEQFRSEMGSSPCVRSVQNLVEQKIIPEMQKLEIPDGSRRKKYPFLDDRRKRKDFLASYTTLAHHYFHGDCAAVPDWSNGAPNRDELCEACGNFNGTTCELIPILQNISSGFDPGEDS